MAERENPVNLTYKEDLLDHLAENAFSQEYGARNLRRYVQKNIEDKIAAEILANHKNPVKEIDLSVFENTINVISVSKI